MKQGFGGFDCSTSSWIVGGLGGLLIAVLLMVLAGFGFFGAVIFGAIAGFAIGMLLNWKYCGSLPFFDDASAPEPFTAPSAPTAPSEPASAPVAASEPAESSSKVVAEAAATPAAVATAPAAAKAKPAAKPAKKAPAKKPAAKKAVTDKPAAKAAVKTATAKPVAKPAVAKDGKPELLTGPRDGGADDLKQIKGVGVQMETMLNGMGIYHFDQVGSWRKKEVEWVDANMPRFKGRASRDEWVKQAKVLAKGGETEFSKKVKKGNVY